MEKDIKKEKELEKEKESGTSPEMKEEIFGEVPETAAPEEKEPEGQETVTEPAIPEEKEPACHVPEPAAPEEKEPVNQEMEPERQEMETEPAGLEEKEPEDQETVMEPAAPEEKEPEDQETVMEPAGPEEKEPEDQETVTEPEAPEEKEPEKTEPEKPAQHVAPVNAVPVNTVPVSTASADEKPVKKKKKRSAARMAFRITLLLILLALGGIYYYGYEYCGTHFMPGTRINIFNCSGLTEEEVHERFAEAAKHYVINVRFRGGSTEVLNAADIGFEYREDSGIAKILQEQDQTLWPKYFFEDHTYSIEVSGACDEEKLQAALKALPELQEENMEKPENAYIRFRDGNEEVDGEFEIVPDTEGSTIDVVQLAAAVGDAAARYEEMIDAEEIEGAYIKADVLRDDPKLVSRCKDLNDLVGASITYVMPDDEKIRLNADVMKDWLVKDEKGRLVKDEDVWDEHLWAFMQELANHGNTLGMNRRFNSSLRGPITVSGGDYGYMVNQIVEHDLLLEDLPACKKETREPSYYLTPYNKETENDGIGTSYIEVDLAAQHVWCYINGELVMDSDCVSGMTSDGHATPTGVFGIMFMKKDATLRGIMQKNGEYEYETKVSYWMPFYDGCGFHDAWWRTAFGGEIYVKDGSHGCINLPVDAAKTLFSYCDEKMPVVVYN